jgi:serpin B
MRLTDFRRDPEVARREVNAWVAEQTRGRIPELVHPRDLTCDTVLLLANAIYFRGYWSMPFSRRETTDAPFRRLDGTTIPVPMMHRIWRDAHARGKGYQAIELEYRGSNARMLIVLPDEGSYGEVERALSSDLVSEIVTALKPTLVELSMPRFAYASRLDLGKILSAMGMRSAFSARANLTGMADDPDLHIGAAVHQADIVVDEEGTEAAAATDVGVLLSAPPRPQVVLALDRPFIYVIRDRATGSVLFLGRVLDPLA